MPALYAHSDPRKVKIDFSTPQQNPHSGHGSYQSAPMYVRPGHDGMRDIGSPGGGKRVLLLRGLDSMTTPDEVIRRIGQEIARMVGKQGRESEAESSIVRVVLIVDKSARSSWGYGFVELATSEVSLFAFHKLSANILLVGFCSSTVLTLSTASTDGLPHSRCPSCHLFL